MSMITGVKYEATCQECGIPMVLGKHFSVVRRIEVDVMRCPKCRRTMPAKMAAKVVADSTGITMIE